MTVQIPKQYVMDHLKEDILSCLYKHFIGPITASEVDYKMNELKKGIVQVRNYFEILKKLNKVRVTYIEGFAIHGLLITHKPMPVPVHNKADVRITDMATFIKT